MNFGGAGNAMKTSRKKAQSGSFTKRPHSDVTHTSAETAVVSRAEVALSDSAYASNAEAVMTARYTCSQCSCVLPAFASIATRFTANRRARYADQSRSATSAVGFPLLSDGHARDRSSRLLRRTPIANCSNLIIPAPVSLDGCGGV
jgi:hypothetical protein